MADNYDFTSLALMPNINPGIVAGLAVDISAFNRISIISNALITPADTDTCRLFAAHLRTIIDDMQPHMTAFNDKIEEKRVQLTDGGHAIGNRGVDQETINLLHRRIMLERFIEELEQMIRSVEAKVSAHHAAAEGGGQAHASDEDEDDEDGDDTEDDDAEDDDEEDNEQSIFACIQCGKTYARQRSHRQHVRMSHPGLQCRHPTCGLTTTTERDMLRHLEASHIISSDVILNEQSRFPCSWASCGKTFKAISCVRRCVLYHKTAA
ncbi:Uu.00g130940.m01.CDS01 [Anthostomella pinea]|uniref:Uu.00g130940.m01.CDS01 n=1 Tax=Anthostomella pinea TaxID=933095 RepID=A0AAI8YI43_9PEZI|nr:Uu.00g130940.m01.CDS01 [Anthostomella pinea]